MNILQQGNINPEANRIAVLGTFDGVHKGHQFLLDFMKAQAQQRGLEPTVITFAQHPLATIRPNDIPPMLSTLENRLIHLEKCGIDCCIVLDFNEQLQQMTAREFLNMILLNYGIKTLVIGFNTQFGKDRIKGVEQYKAIGEEVGIEVIQAPEYGEGVCSSAIRRHLLNGEIIEANEALGYRFSLCGKVVKGKQLGRTIGFPTANIEVSDSKMLTPGNGVYVVDVTIPHLGKTYRGMLNIGRRPTVDVANAPLSIEVHIINFNGDIYDKEINVEFVKFIREERPFPTLDALIAQLTLDSQEAMK
ncbi:MAG: bifunctional riboflavin kinase/FAD synthetase [Muribaculaceae bacterium]|nr:bifunctional riboflavin kinase/FAD synthetase [Muribaculaceae bacterium]